MSIETLTDWNTRLGYCGCCPMPVCPTPVVVCECVAKNVNSDEEVETPTAPEGHYARKSWFRPFRIDGAVEGEDLPEIYSVYRATPPEQHYTGEYQYYLRFADNPPPFEVYSAAVEQRLDYDVDPLTGGWIGTSQIIVLSNNTYDEGFRDVIQEEDNTYSPGEATPDVITENLPDEWECEPSSRHEKSNWIKGEAGTLGALPGFTGMPGVSFFGTFNDEYLAYYYEEFRERDETLENSITKAGLVARAVAGLEEEEWETWTCESKLTVNWPLVPAGVVCADAAPTGFLRSSNLRVTASVTVRKLRFRFRIPHTHTGSKFWITYDIAEFPADGDPSFFSEDNVVEWTGPGTGASSDPSWLTPWVEIDPPEVSGERRIVNIRYTCYSGSRYGAKPQVMGEAFTPPPP